MDALLVSTVAVAVAEIGDKTQLLALVLAARYRKPWPICAGILLATLVNHALAGELGVLVTQWLLPETLRWLIVLSFLAVAVWALFPDKIDAGEASRRTHRGVFVASAVGFFLAEMGDRTQIATAVLAASYQPLSQGRAGHSPRALPGNAA